MTHRAHYHVVYMHIEHLTYGLISLDADFIHGSLTRWEGPLPHQLQTAVAAAGGWSNLRQRTKADFTLWLKVV